MNISQPVGPNHCKGSTGWLVFGYLLVGQRVKAAGL